MAKYEIWAKVMQTFMVEADSEEAALDLFQKSITNPNLPIEFGIVHPVETTIELNIPSSEEDKTDNS